jgi:hypothetical protein
MTMKIEKLKEKIKQFREWQQKPHLVAPMSDETHQCATCGTQFQGNFCPRCGQSSKIGRYSFKNAFLLFLDVWGLGNRGMFRTIRDLILRPGYMIRDYLQGMQMAYYPPFKMFFLFIALSLLVETGMNIRMENRMEMVQEQFTKGMTEAVAEDKNLQEDHAASIDNSETELSSEELEEARKKEKAATDAKAKIDGFSDRAYDWSMRHISLVTMLFLLLFSAPLYLFFRKSPAYPGIRFSEFFVAMVYSMNMVELYSALSEFFCLNMMLETFLLLLIIIPIKQLSGYSYWRTLLNFFLALIVFSGFIFVVLVIITFVGVLFYTS